jgi:hypothetical protein
MQSLVIKNTPSKQNVLYINMPYPLIKNKLKDGGNIYAVVAAIMDLFL